MTVAGGTCRSCKRPLVQDSERTYHPAAILPADAYCPALLPIPGTTDLMSFNVDPGQFIPEGTDR